MEDLIVQAFDHIDALGPHVREGHYDLEGPEGELILKNIWETTVQPGWQVTMKMWPQLENHPTRPRMPPMPANMSPQQQQQWIHMQRARAAAAAAAHRGGPARPMSGHIHMPAINRQPPPPPNAHFAFPSPGEGPPRPDIRVMNGGTPGREKAKKEKETKKKVANWVLGRPTKSKKSVLSLPAVCAYVTNIRAQEAKQVIIRG